MQSKLLRTLQEGTLVRLGGKQRSASVNVRVVAATNRDLAREVDHRPLPPGPVLPAQRDPDPACRRCASGARTSARWRCILVSRANQAHQRNVNLSRPTRWRGWKTTPGPATSANSAT
jgi:Nif-specific regulatory protein